MRHRPAERLGVDVLARHGPDDVGPRDEHVRRLLHHEDEVGDRRGVDAAARAGPHDQADLRHDAGRPDVAQEDVGVGAERHDALLDARAAAVVDADDRAADAGREVHDLADLLADDLAERAAEDGEVLGEDADAAALDGPVAGDDRVAPGPVALHVEVRRAMPDERVQLREGAGVQQPLDALARGELAAVVLLALLLGRGVDRGLAQLLQLGEAVLERLGWVLRHGEATLVPCRAFSSAARVLCVVRADVPAVAHEERRRPARAARLGARRRRARTRAGEAPLVQVAAKRSTSSPSSSA